MYFGVTGEGLEKPRFLEKNMHSRNAVIKFRDPDLVTGDRAADLF